MPKARSRVFRVLSDAEQQKRESKRENCPFLIVLFKVLEELDVHEKVTFSCSQISVSLYEVCWSMLS
jgi:hypothetical protein